MIKIELIDLKQAVKRNFSLKILSDVIQNRMKLKIHLNEIFVLPTISYHDLDQKPLD
jgi:hypothetical protein